jgi:hypothetical protein
MDETDRGFWNDAYSGNPAPAVVEGHVLVDRETEGLQPGRALDLG